MKTRRLSNLKGKERDKIQKELMKKGFYIMGYCNQHNKSVNELSWYGDKIFISERDIWVEQ